MRKLLIAVILLFALLTACGGRGTQMQATGSGPTVTVYYSPT